MKRLLRVIVLFSKKNKIKKWKICLKGVKKVNFFSEPIKTRSITHRWGRFKARIVQPLPRPAAVNLCSIQHPGCPVGVIPYRNTGKSSARGLRAPPGLINPRRSVFVMHRSTQGTSRARCVSEASKFPPHISRNAAVLETKALSWVWSWGSELQAGFARWVVFISASIRKLKVITHQKTDQSVCVLHKRGISKCGTVHAHMRGGKKPYGTCEKLKLSR